MSQTIALSAIPEMNTPKGLIIEHDIKKLIAGIDKKSGQSVEIVNKLSQQVVILRSAAIQAILETIDLLVYSEKNQKLKIGDKNRYHLTFFSNSQTITQKNNLHTIRDNIDEYRRFEKEFRPAVWCLRDFAYRDFECNHLKDFHYVTHVRVNPYLFSPGVTQMIEEANLKAQSRNKSIQEWGGRQVVIEADNSDDFRAVCEFMSSKRRFNQVSLAIGVTRDPTTGEVIVTHYPMATGDFSGGECGRNWGNLWFRNRI